MTEKKEIEFVIPGKGKRRKNELIQFANYILAVSEKIGFKLSSRGWAYQLEGFNVIQKGQFNRIQKLINICRKKGLLPIDFVAEDSSRRLQGLFDPDDKSPEQDIFNALNGVLTRNKIYHPDYWKEFDCYIILLVEKVDLVTLFEPVCEEYNIKIANAKGWSSILQRAKIAEEFKLHEEENEQTPIILYCGDLDPFGEAISDKLKKNFRDIEEGTGWSPENLVVDRFGLNKDFVDEHNLTWIDNLQTGSGREADRNNPIVKKYIAQYGERKVEANAIVVIPDEARKLCKRAIENYLGEDALRIIREVKQNRDKYFVEIMNDIDIHEQITDAMKKVLVRIEEKNIDWID